MLTAWLSLLIAMILLWWIKQKRSTTHNSNIVEGFLYRRGMQGPAGSQGPPGPIGPVGPAGSIGETGETGPRGRPGPKGSRGPEGPIGVTGPRGERGFDGFPGPVGQKGPRGDRGKTGPHGLQGPKGPTGPRGWMGLKGDPGTFGENSCKFFGSDSPNGWKCPTTHPVYVGASLSAPGMGCQGGIARNASCKGSTGSGGSAKSFVSGGRVTDIQVLSTGRNYRDPPLVKFVSREGVGASARSEITNGELTNIVLLDGGRGYRKPPQVVVEATDAGFGASARAQVNGGRMTQITVIHSGRNYQVAPNIKIIGGGGDGGEATARVRNGNVVAIRVNDGGSGYTEPPVVVIEPSPARMGCNYCHMCCRKNPSQQSKLSQERKYQKQLEKQLTEHDKQLSRLEVMLKQQNQRRDPIRNHRRKSIKQRSEQEVIKAEQEEERIEERSIKKQDKKDLRRLQKLRSEYDQMIKQDDGNANPNDSIPEPEPPSFAKSLTPEEEAILKRYQTGLKKNRFSQAEIASRMSRESNRLAGHQFINWAPRSKITVSSSIKNHPASNVIDGKLSTWVETRLQTKPWIKVNLPISVEISEIRVKNKLGSVADRRRLIPFELRIYDPSKKVIGRKEYRDASSSYQWSSIDMVGSVVELVCKGDTILHISSIEVYGKQASTPAQYLSRSLELTAQIKAKQSTGDKPDPALLARQLRAKQLADSVKSVAPKNPLKDPQERAKLAKAFQKLLNKKFEKRKAVSVKAQKKLEVINRTIEAEKAVAIEAKKLGMPPPPSRYTTKEIAMVKKYAALNPPDMSEKDKARCMMLYRIANDKRSSAESYGIYAMFIPFLRPSAKSKGRRAEQALALYNRECEMN